MSFKDFFKTDTENDCVYFLGNKLECFIPTRYRDKGYLQITDKVSCIGYFDMKIDDSIELGLQVPGVISIGASDTYETTIDDQQYVVCSLFKGDKLMTTLDIIEDNRIPYFIWMEFLALGHIPKYLKYHKIATVFDDMKEFCGTGIGANHAVFEVVLAHLFRNKNNLAEFYRHTSKKEDPVLINLRNVAYSASTTHSRIVGSFSDDGRTAAMLTPNEENHVLEDLFRA